MATQPREESLTQRELEVMHVFWRNGELTAAEARGRLAAAGIDRAYVTVANLVRILIEKNYLETTNDQRPFRYRPRQSFDDVSRGLVSDLVKRVFHGSREQLLVSLLDGPKKLSSKELALLQQVLKEQQK